ncbi:Sapep family Mn(2+)-dependent dipeptidase [Eggerthellaceae bacterium 3-80]|nr:M20 family peptidase [bacterium D16-34]
MKQAELTTKIDEYLDQNWNSIVEDIRTLVEIPSFEEPELAAPGEPFGPGPAAALDKALSIAAGMGFDTANVDGFMGYADFPGKSETQVGIIGHLDVVPAGPGWTFPPFKVTEKDGYLMGRGTLDDKGPVMIALYAMKFWKDQGVEFPYTLRFLFGANEETDLRDVEYYRERFADPAFLFTPDAEFPVCYGEKGGYNGTITSEPMPDRVVLEMKGGAATNAVPGEAEATILINTDDLQGTDNITLERLDEDRVRIFAKGKSAHASMPETGVNAIALIIDYLLENNIGTPKEQDWFKFEKALLENTDGSGVGLATSDEHFGPLTIIGGTVATENDCFVQTVDSRYPTSISGDEIQAILSEQADKVGAGVENTMLLPPFLVSPESPVIQALLSAYNEATGQDAKPFTIGGGTYAREFTSGASFGPEMPWIEIPEWVGGMHGPDEGVSIDLLKEAFRIYVLTIDKLMQLDL